jgi:hypothetical protein
MPPVLMEQVVMERAHAHEVRQAFLMCTSNLGRRGRESAGKRQGKISGKFRSMTTRLADRGVREPYKNRAKTARKPHKHRAPTAVLRRVTIDNVAAADPLHGLG